MANAAAAATVVHSTYLVHRDGWHVASCCIDIPHVLTAHSPSHARPWKAEQPFGGGYRVSLWVERTAIEPPDAVIAVSSGCATTSSPCIRRSTPIACNAVKNGIDTDVWYPAPA